VSPPSLPTRRNVPRATAALTLLLLGGGGAGTSCRGSESTATRAADAGRDATVRDASAGSDAALDGGQDDGPEGGLDDGALPGDDGGGSGGEDVGDVWTHPPLPWDACDVFDASGLDEASVAAGLAAVEYFDCPICHEHAISRDDGGSIVLHLAGNALGNGVYPPNLTNSPDGIGCWTNAEVQRAILFGLDREGGPLCPPMPVWSAHGMDAAAAAAIVDFLRSLPPSENVLPDTTCAGVGPDAASD
jgi:hypothetical protein